MFFVTQGDRRLVLTGTPLQNNLVELISLLAFVMPDLFTDKTEHIKKIFTCITVTHSLTCASTCRMTSLTRHFLLLQSRASYDSKGSFERQTILQAKEILKPFFLRRLKRDVSDYI